MDDNRPSRSTRVIVEFTGRIELPCQGWGIETKLDQVYKQAQQEVDHWQMMVKKGTRDPEFLPHIKATVTDVILPISS